MNRTYTIDDKTATDLAEFLTQFAQMQRVMRNHEAAERAEVIRNTLYAQHAEHIKP